MLQSPMLKAQVPVERSSEIVKIGGKEYYMHHVKQGQTLYGISHAYQVTIEEIERLNPEVKNGLKADDVIGIPVQTVQESEEANVQKTETEHPNNESSGLKVGKDYEVQQGEDLYAIAKKFGIDVSEFKVLNPGLTNNPKAGTKIKVPDIVNTDDYIVHKVEYNERTTSLLKRWKVSESEFRAKNISVGSHVFVNQVVLIPIDRVEVIRDEQEMVVEEVEIDDEEMQTSDLPQDIAEIEEVESVETPECSPSSENASVCYKVVLMIPLYLQEVGSLEVSKENLSKAQKARSFSFLQYYEGFMMAVDELTKNHGLKLDLTVIDVTDNVATAHDALKKIEGKNPDLIVGPFFGKSFGVVEAYAKEKGIIMVNPLSTRESVIENNPNVVKVKPNLAGQVMEIANLVKYRYLDSNIFIISKEDESDSDFLAALERQLNAVVSEEVSVSSSEFLRYAREESERKEMGEKMVRTVDVEGLVYSTDELKATQGNVTLHNQIRRYTYSASNMNTLKLQLSGVRNNLVIAYGNDNVFATQMLNMLKKETDSKKITLVAIPDWTKFEKLLVDNLLDMNTIYFSDFFVDYRDKDIKDFVVKFRRKYACEPQSYAFEGYDVAWYFLNGLMRYGHDMLDCLPNFSMPLFHTQYHFSRKNTSNGLENQSWSIYQYDAETIELHPIDPMKTTDDE